MWMTVVFFGTKMSAHVPPVDLWESYARIDNAGTQPTTEHVLAQVSDDGPCRWLRLADLENDLG